MRIFEPITIKEHINSSGEQQNSPAFFRLLELCRPLNIPDDNEELNAWRMERFIHEDSH